MQRSRLTDGDGTADCLDQCRGVDEDLFAPGCATAIPAASAWGFTVLALLLLVLAKLAFTRRCAV